MSLDISRRPTDAQSDGLDGWLLYDFHGSNPIAVKLVGLPGKHTTRRWYYFIPASGTPVKLVHAIEPAMLDGVPGDERIYAGRLRARSRASATCSAASKTSRWSTRRRAPSRTSRAWTPARWTSSGGSACAWCRRATWSDASRRPGTRRRSPRTARRRSSSTASRIGRSTTSARSSTPASRCTSTRSSSRWSAGCARKASSPTRRRSSAAQENAGNPHYAPTRGAVAADPPERSAAARPLGQARPAGRGLRRHHLGGICRRSAAEDRARVSAPSSPAAMRAVAVVKAAVGAGQADSRLGGRPRDARRHHRRRLRRALHPPDRPQPRRGSARQRRAHGRLRDPRRSPAPARHGIHDRARHLHGAVRRPDRDQYGGGRPVGGSHRAAASRRS